MNLIKTLLPAMLLTGIYPGTAEALAEPVPPSRNLSTDTATLKTIEVTARKKSEELQQVPMSVVALDAADQEKRGIDNLTDLANVVPGLQQGVLAVTSRLTLRGVNSGDNNAFEQSVGVYVDGIYRGRMNQQHIGLFDLQRIEVLKGPQVTIYGNSSIGGAISAITRKPSFEAGGDIRIGYEFEHQEPRIEAGFDIPVSEQLALRVAGKWLDQGKGNAFNEYSGDTEPKTGAEAIRFSARWLPTDALTVDFRHERGQFKRDGNIFDVYKHVDGQGQPWPNSPFSGLDDGRFNVGNGAPFKYRTPFMDTDMEETMLEFQYQFNDLTFTSITGLSRYDYRLSEDVDLSPSTVINVYQDESYRQFSQELRLAGDVSERVDFLVGFYLQNDTFRNDYLSDFNMPELLAPLFGVPSSGTSQLISPFSRHILIDQDTRQWALFGNLDWEFNEKLTASFGFRYLAIEKHAKQAVRTASIDHVDGAGPLVDARWLSPALAPLLLSNAAYLADPTNYVLVLGDGTQIAPVLVPSYSLGYNIVSGDGGVTHEFKGLSRKEKHPMFQTSLAYQWSDDLMIYASWANGAKAGGFDFLYEGGNTDNVEYNPEQANVFEVGFKKDWQNLRLNMAAFYGKYDDLQVSVFDGTIGFVVGNAASSTSKGIEGELTWNISDSWRMHAHFEYLNFRYDDFRDANCSTTERLNTGAILCVWSGDRTPFVPDFEGILAIEHSRQIGSNWLLNQSLGWSYKGSHSTASDNEIQTRQSAYHLFDYRISLTSPGKAWSLALVGKNLTDEKYNVFTSVIPLAPGGAFANVKSKGREVALEWHYRF